MESFCQADKIDRLFSLKSVLNWKLDQIDRILLSPEENVFWPSLQGLLSCLEAVEVEELETTGK